VDSQSQRASIAVCQLLRTNAAAARTTVDSVCVHVRHISQTTPTFQMNDGRRQRAADDVTDLRRPYGYNTPHNNTQTSRAVQIND